MKQLRLILILTFGFRLLASSQAAVHMIFPITSDTLFLPSGDSFNVEQFGNRFSAYKESAYILMSPTNMIRVRDISRAGDDDLGGATNREPVLGVPYVGALHGTNDVVLQLYCSGNHVPPPFNTTGSNYTYTNLVTRLFFPTFTFNRFAVLTNDWSQPTNRIWKEVIGDAGYYQGAALDSDPNAAGAYLQSLGGSNAALQANVLWVDSYHNNLPIITNGYPANSNLWFNAPNFDHPGTVIQVERGIRDLVSEGMDTNALTLVIDCSAVSISESNHCTFTNLTKIGNTVSGYLRPQRLSMAYDAGDAQHTNDARPAFVIDPALSNSLFEVVRWTNAMNGTHVISINGVPVATNVCTTGDFSVNFFHVTTGAIWDQKMSVLDGCRIMRDVSPIDASTYTGQQFTSYFNSQAGSAWATNTGVDSYIATMTPYAQVLYAQDNTNHVNAQPQTFLISDTVIVPRKAPFHL